MSLFSKCFTPSFIISGVGPIVHIKLGFEEIVVLNKASDAEELVSHFLTLH